MDLIIFLKDNSSKKDSNKTNTIEIKNFKKISYRDVLGEKVLSDKLNIEELNSIDIIKPTNYHIEGEFSQTIILGENILALHFQKSTSKKKDI